MSDLQDKVNASTEDACGSGLYETYFANCLFILEANKSISGTKSSSISAFVKQHLSSIHSDAFSFLLDSKSATKLSRPGICAALIHICLSIHHSQTCLANELHFSEWLVPILLIILTAEVLSILNLMCELDIVLANVFKPRKVANNSK